MLNNHMVHGCLPGGNCPRCNGHEPDENICKCGELKDENEEVCVDCQEDEITKQLIKGA